MLVLAVAQAWMVPGRCSRLSCTCTLQPYGPKAPPLDPPASAFCNIMRPTALGGHIRWLRCPMVAPAGWDAPCPQPQPAILWGHDSWICQPGPEKNHGCRQGVSDLAGTLLLRTRTLMVLQGPESGSQGLRRDMGILRPDG